MGNATEPSKGPPPKEDGQEDYENALKELSNGRIEEAMRLLRKAIDEADYPKARIQLGLMFRDGRGVEVNAKEAKNLFMSGAEDGVGEMQVALMYLRGLGVEKNTTKAIELLKEAIEKFDNMDAQSHLGFLYVSGQEDIQFSFPEGIRLLTEAAKTSAEAEAYFGLMNMEGIGVARNYPLAIEHLTKAVDAGHLKAHIYLAELYMQGKGAARQPWSAAKLLLRASEKGNARAQCYIGVMYRDGIGVTENQKVAQKWLQASAHQGDPLGMYSWGKYLLDNSSEWDWVTVVDWLTKAAAKGNTEGEFEDDLYIDGLARVFNLEEQ